MFSWKNCFNRKDNKLIYRCYCASWHVVREYLQLVRSQPVILSVFKLARGRPNISTRLEHELSRVWFEFRWFGKYMWLFLYESLFIVLWFSWVWPAQAFFQLTCLIFSFPLSLILVYHCIWGSTDLQFLIACQNLMTFMLFIRTDRGNQMSLWS